MYKKVIASVLALTLVAGAVAAPAVDVVSLGSGISASAEGVTTFEMDNFKYKVTSEEGASYKTVALDGVATGRTPIKITLDEFVVGPDHNTYYITSVSDGAFADYTTLYTVDFSKTAALNKIGANAFKGCRNITTVVLPDDLAEIGKSAFEGCYARGENGDNLEVTPITIGKKVAKVGDRAFANCITLEEASVDATVVGDEVFAGSENLKKVTFGSSVTQIGKRVLKDCKGLKEVTIGTNSQLTTVPESFCENCDDLGKVEIPNNIRVIEKNAFAGCTDLEQVSLSQNLRAIDEKAFFDCGMKSITIPDAVTSLGEKCVGFDNNGKEPKFVIYSNASASSEIYKYAKGNNGANVTFDLEPSSASNPGLGTGDTGNGNVSGGVGTGGDINNPGNTDTPGTTPGNGNNTETNKPTGTTKKSIAKLSLTSIKKLKNGKDYKVTAKNSAKGTVTVKGIGNYTGTRVVKIGKATVKAAVGKKYIKVSRAKSVAGATGYQFYRTGKTVSTRSTSTTFKGLKSKKKYRVKVRAYIKLGSKVYYGPWSASKVVTVK